MQNMGTHFYCNGTLGYFLCRGESEPRFAGLSKKMAHSRLLYLIETGRINRDEESIVSRQIENSSLPNGSKKTDCLHVSV